MYTVNFNYHKTLNILHCVTVMSLGLFDEFQDFQNYRGIKQILMGLLNYIFHLVKHTFLSKNEHRTKFRQCPPTPPIHKCIDHFDFALLHISQGPSPRRCIGMPLRMRRPEKVPLVTCKSSHVTQAVDS